jgi:hypothetical protein
VNAGFQIMYVWCDLVKEQIVGDIKGSILQVIVPEYSDGKRDWTTEPSNLIAVELADNISLINEIHVRITDSLGRDLEYKD